MKPQRTDQRGFSLNGREWHQSVTIETRDGELNFNPRQMSSGQNVLQTGGSDDAISASNRTRGDKHSVIPRQTNSGHSIVQLKGSDGPIEDNNRMRGVNPGEEKRPRMNEISGEVPLV